MNFFDSVLAGTDSYRDIISIVVDEDTYGIFNQKSNIDRYAKDIAEYLWGVRTVIMVVDPGTSVATIAEKNEQLYYEWDGGDGSSALVGTILIGNIPIPIVEKDGKSFSSMNPYVDFVDKSFVYDTKTKRYKYSSTDAGSESVEIWHGVINPAVGRAWSSADIWKIWQFLDKTHDFYKKNGKFALSSVPPKVFYYDGLAEAKSIDSRWLYQYALTMANAENIAYNRFTKYLLRDINKALEIFDNKSKDPEMTSLYADLGLSEWSDTLTGSQIEKLPDIKSKEVILWFLKNFKGIFNSKTLGEELLAVHNAGRYKSGATVRADILPVSISLMDDLARATLRAANEWIAKQIDTHIKTKAKPIIVFDKSVIKYLSTENYSAGTHTGSINSSGVVTMESHNGWWYGEEPWLQAWERVYQNYFFWKPAREINSVTGCTIARWYATDLWTYGRSVLVEANAAFDINSTQTHIATLSGDTATLVGIHGNANYACFGSNSAKTTAYWWKNSVLSLMGSGGPSDAFLFWPSPLPGTFTWFTLPIFSLGWMKETSRLPNPSINNCIDTLFQYTLLQPYLRTYIDDTIWFSRARTVAYPDEWNRWWDSQTSSPRFTCIDPVHSWPLPSPLTLRGIPIPYSTSLSEYASSTCLTTKLSWKIYLDWLVVRSANNYCTDTQGFWDDQITVDTTHYEDRYYHKIPGNIWSHVSPTDEEIAAAKVSGVTPSLPVDQIRFVEYYDGSSVKEIKYPNFFDSSGSTVNELRTWLVSKSPLGLSLNIDSASLEKIIQAKSWLHPDIALKYKEAIESMLSYSGANIELGTAPIIPSLSQEYEIAYLGLPSTFGADFSQSSSSEAQAGYNTTLREIEWINITEEAPEEDKDANPASECGPPDGVPLLEWPAAIMCWIQKQLPPRILAGSCGPSTIGLESGSQQNVVSLAASGTSNPTAIDAFYAGASIIPHLPRSSLRLRDSISINLDIQKGDKILAALADTVGYIEIVRATDSAGVLIPTTELSRYLSIASQSGSIVWEKWAQFIVQSLGKEATLELKAYYMVPYPDGSTFRISNSANFTLRITPEYYSLSLVQSGTSITNIDVTGGPVTLQIDKILSSGLSTPAIGSSTYEISDDLSGDIIYTGSVSNWATIPYLKTGVYRMIIQGSGITGELTFAVQSGKLSRIIIEPISSVLVKGNSTLAVIKLQDRLSNPVSPDLYSLKLDIVGVWYMTDLNGNNKTTMNMDVMESQIPIVVGSANPWNLAITATVVENGNTTTATKIIKVLDNAKIVLNMPSTAQVWWLPVSARIEVQDSITWNPILGLSSVASWKLPDGAGSFSGKTVEIIDGTTSPIPFSYLPGTVSGDHTLTLDIPGIWSYSTGITVMPGIPLYVSHTVDDANIIFSLRDRYNNIATQSTMIWTWTYNSDLFNAPFQNGIYKKTLKWWYYSLTVPLLKNNKLEYKDKDAAGVVTIKFATGSDRYEAYISGKQQTIEFAPDYNARYTVLAGGSFLREAEDILYDVAADKSQSLAVSTILDDPYKQDGLMSVSPWGSYTINGTSYDSSLESSISLSSGYPLLTVTDVVTRKQVARVLYSMQNAVLCLDSGCSPTTTIPRIQLKVTDPTEYSGSINNGTLLLKYSNANILSIWKNWAIQANSRVTLVPNDTATNGLEMSVMLDDIEIATLTYVMDSTKSVEKSPVTTKNTPVIISYWFSIQTIAGNPLNTTKGFNIFRTTLTKELDETKNGPSHTNSLGALSEVPGVGWQWNNTMLLAYAGGDTVGETTKFFHTYSLVNLGDPVTHVDHNSTNNTQIDGIDRTLGSIIARGTRSGIVDVFHKDMDKDTLEDLIVSYEDGYMELFLNRAGKFRSRWMIMYNKDLDTKKIAFGDFRGDGFSDIVWLNSSGSLILIDNTDRKFARVNITLSGAWIIPQHISQFHIYNMDADTRDDIVYLTAGGELGILYGTLKAGEFIEKILDSSLAIELWSDAIIAGGAITGTGIGIPVITNSTESTIYDASAINSVSSSSVVVSTTPSSIAASAEFDDSTLKWEVYYQYARPTPVQSRSDVTLTELSWALDNIADGSAAGSRMDTYVRSQYASGYSLDISKKYTKNNAWGLQPNERIQATITINNTSSSTLSNIEYLDTIPKVFSVENTREYRIVGWSADGSTGAFLSIGDNEFDTYFSGGTLGAGQSMTISYDLIALPASYGELIVWDLEKNADPYGDVGLKTSTTCWASMLQWLSDSTFRTYPGRTIYNFLDSWMAPDLAAKLLDSDGNGIPDSIENTWATHLTNMLNNFQNTSSQVGGQSLMSAIQNGGSISIWFDPDAVDNIINATQDLMDGLSCGFGWWGCLNFPLNWAPLAPGTDPALFGNPIGDGLKVDEWIPVFSALTAINIPTPGWCYQAPVIWPISPFEYTGTCNTTLGAWWMLGIDSNSNFLRIFVTPTLTLGMGTAICMGASAKEVGSKPGKWLSPLVQWWNCIVMAKSMPVCKSDGSAEDGDVRGISGLETIDDTWNASSCHPKANTITEEENQFLMGKIVGYLKNPDPEDLKKHIYPAIAKRGPRVPSWPLLSIRGGWGGGGAIDIEIDSNTKVSDIGSVIKIKNKRIASFPDFLMDWLSRQQEEITTSLFTPPSFTIIPPSSYWQNAQADKSHGGISKKLDAAYSKESFDNIKKSMVTTFNKPSVWTSNVPAWLQSTVWNVKGTLNSIKTAYTMIGKLPFITLSQSTIPLNIPWIDKRELDKYERSLKGYKDTVTNAGNKLCLTSDTPAQCAAKKASLSSGPFINSIIENLKRIEDYKRFPMKIQKYITWKERYIAQILCNINIIQEITGWWLRDNGVRFRKWAELFVLIKAIAEGWQPIIDIFRQKDESCGVCRNERNNLQYWKFKLLSMLIPSIPVLKFPKWPDIVLDLSDIRFGISISMPNFDPRISPIRLPDLPSLWIGDISATAGLPALQLLPPIPPLPDLPDLPSLPKVKLPDLPPPPKIPKLAGSIAAFLNIMKLISKMYCFYQKTFLIPEWQVGDVIANRTERQGTMSFDFINLDLPQFSLPSLKEIRVWSHVNYSLKSDFITEFARTAVKPVNAFQTDLKLGIPSKIGEDLSVPSVRVRIPQTYNFENNSKTATWLIAELNAMIEADKNVSLDIDEFRDHIISEFSAPEFTNNRLALQRELKTARIDAEKIQNELIAYNDKRFSLLKEYVTSESDNVAHLQNIVDLLNEDMSSVPRELIADIAATASRSDRLLAQYNKFQDVSIGDDVSMDQEVWLSRTRSALDSKLSRMIAYTTTTGTPASVSTNIAEWYSPHYQGIYIITPITKKQTQLFDYIAPLWEDTRIDTIDIDKDTDKDYIYVLDGILYVKYSWEYPNPNPRKINDTTIKTKNISSTDPTPYVPDYFHENNSSPKNLNYSFVASSSGETEWRVEFYDRYIEWDKNGVESWYTPPIPTPKTTIDMFTTIPTTPVASHTGIVSQSVPRSLKHVDHENSFQINGRGIDVYTGALSISISPGRVLYTGNDPVTIIYTNQTTTTATQIILTPHTWYQFAEITEITTAGWKLYVIGEEDNSQHIYSDDYIGMPILPGMQIYASDSGSLIYNHTTSSSIVLRPETQYFTYDLGDKNTKYEVSLPYLNGYYYARLKNLTTGRTDRAWVELFTPQESSDDGAPVVDLPAKIRLPIYSKKSFDFADILSDRSSATITIDGDSAIDGSDSDSIADNDFETTGTGFNIGSSSIIFGEFDKPGMYNMTLNATDSMGNTTTVPFIVEAYALIPQIQSVTTSVGDILGSVNEPMIGTPVHFFRVRPGEAPIFLSPGATDTIGGWQFNTGSFFKSSEAINLKTDWGNITINNKGVFGALPAGYSVTVNPASSSVPMQFVIKNWSDITHTHTLALPDDVVFIDGLKNPPSSTFTWVVITPVSGSSNVVPASLSAPTYITDSTSNGFVYITRDGYIYIARGSTATLSYSTSTAGYILIDVMSAGVSVAKIEYRINFFYSMK